MFITYSHRSARSPIARLLVAGVFVVSPWVQCAFGQSRAVARPASGATVQRAASGYAASGHAASGHSTATPLRPYADYRERSNTRFANTTTQQVSQAAWQNRPVGPYEQPSAIRQAAYLQLPPVSTPDNSVSTPNSSVTDTTAAHGNTAMPVGPALPSAISEVTPLSEVDDGFSFNFKDTPWNLVIAEFAERLGLSLQLSHSVDGTFTYFDQRFYSNTETLDILNDYLILKGAILVQQGEKLILLRADTSIPESFVPFVPIGRLPSLGRNQLASVALPVFDSDATAIATEVQELLSPVGRVNAMSSSRRIVVTDTGHYLRRIYDLITGGGVATGNPRSVVYELQHARAEEVAAAVNQFFAAASGQVIAEGGVGGGVVVAETTSNSLIIRDVGVDGDDIHSMIQQLDRPPRQVLIQALIVEVLLGNTDEHGVELGFQDSVLFDRGVIDNILTISETTTAPNGVQTTNQRIVSQTASPGFNFNNQPLGNNVAASPTHVASQMLSSLAVGRVNGDLGFGGLVLSAGSESINVLLRALSAQFNIDILSRPHIRAIDNREALIQIGQQVPVVDGVAVNSIGSANPIIRQDQAGIILRVTPQISPDSRVLIDVQAEKSAYQLAPGTGVPIFTDATTGNVIEAPVKDITTANTIVSVRSGQTIVLGGMITNEDINVERKVPFLGDIPIIKHAFRYKLQDNERRELLIFLTPHVVDSDAHSELLKEDAVSHVHMPCSVGEFDLQLGNTYCGHSLGSPEAAETIPALDGAVGAGAVGAGAVGDGAVGDGATSDYPTHLLTPIPNEPVDQRLPFHPQLPPVAPTAIPSAPQGPTYHNPPTWPSSPQRPVDQAPAYHGQPVRQAPASVPLPPVPKP